ncbi:MAG: DUF5522 domain-containing protein [Reichenbachiella sp.]|uniref:DUF5522 domain-containing protein n=1 Tax=Reichenbachiella sp. TaxID=2184521 RepID=UPI003264D1A1
MKNSLISLKITKSIPNNTNETLFALSDKNDNRESNANKSEDFYFNEQGLMVFTSVYHLKRGYCCKNGCKHCPFGFKQ